MSYYKSRRAGLQGYLQGDVEKSHWKADRKPERAVISTSVVIVFMIAFSVCHISIVFQLDSHSHKETPLKPSRSVAPSTRFFSECTDRFCVLVSRPTFAATFLTKITLTLSTRMFGRNLVEEIASMLKDYADVLKEKSYPSKKNVPSCIVRNMAVTRLPIACIPLFYPLLPTSFLGCTHHYFVAEFISSQPLIALMVIDSNHVSTVKYFPHASKVKIGVGNFLSIEGDRYNHYHLINKNQRVDENLPQLNEFIEVKQGDSLKEKDIWEPCQLCWIGKDPTGAAAYSAEIIPFGHHRNAPLFGYNKSSVPLLIFCGVVEFQRLPWKEKKDAGLNDKLDEDHSSYTQKNTPEVQMQTTLVPTMGTNLLLS
ncbi:hypothetical protein L218DRAFT_988277 [Marasmius fiardii PR-910]|nr:hypothetical protein L218DRAFT_988277 [Marasmius fiardii PR-910]